MNSTLIVENLTQMAELPWDMEKPGKAFRPYKKRLADAWHFLFQNASIIGLAITLMGIIGLI